MDLRNYNFRQSLTAIEDLKSLVASDFHPIADLALHHVEQLKQNSDHEWMMNQKAYSAVIDLMEGQLKSLFQFYASTNTNLQKIQFHNQKETFSLTAWNKLLSSLDLVLRGVSLFRFTETLDIKLSGGQLLVTGKLKKFKIDGDVRVKVYALIRQFLAQEVLFTYDLTESEAEVYLALKFDFSHQENVRLAFTTEHAKSLSFSNMLANYQATNLEKLKGVKHLVLEVDKSYQLSEKEEIPEEYFQAFYSHSADFTVFHFSFLFRPISLIIPNRGELVSSSQKDQAYVNFFSIVNN